MSVDSKDEGFLDRWSKRKKAVEQEELEALEADPAAETLEREPETDEEALEVLRERDPELADEVAAIDIDELTYDDDFSIFMNKKVPEFIRRKALSKLWLSSPVLANVDGLNDYDEDFRDAGSIIEAVQTALSKDDDGAGKTEADNEPPVSADEAVEPETAVSEANQQDQTGVDQIAANRSGEDAAKDASGDQATDTDDDGTKV